MSFLSSTQNLNQFKSLVSREKFFYKKFAEYERGQLEMSQVLADLELADIEYRGIEQRRKITSEALHEMQFAPLELPFPIDSST